MNDTMNYGPNEGSKMMEQYEEELRRLAIKYIGQNDINRYYSKDGFFKQEWVLNRIKYLSIQIGSLKQRMSKCKRTDSKRYKEYEITMIEIERLTDNLITDSIDNKGIEFFKEKTCKQPKIA